MKRGTLSRQGHRSRDNKGVITVQSLRTFRPFLTEIPTKTTLAPTCQLWRLSRLTRLRLNRNYQPMGLLLKITGHAPVAKAPINRKTLHRRIEIQSATRTQEKKPLALQKITSNCHDHKLGRSLNSLATPHLRTDLLRILIILQTMTAIRSFLTVVKCRVSHG